MPRMPPRPRSHSYTGPVTGKPAPIAPPPFHPIHAVISDEHRAAHNLKVLQRHDPAIKVIHDQIPYAVIRLMKPRVGADEDTYWEHQLDGPEGPLFFVERESDDPDSRLGFAVLNTKDIFSWIQVLHRDDEIEFSPEMAIIVPSSRKDVMWPAFLMKASDGLYASFIIRLLARCHLLLKYKLEWPDRWRGGQGKLPEQHVSDPQSAIHDPTSEKTDLLTMIMIGSQITEIERVAEEVVRVVSAGGTWCRNEYIAPPTGWPSEWEEPKGTTKEVWAPVTAKDDRDSPDINGTHAPSKTPPALSDTSTIKHLGPRKEEPAVNGKKKSPQPPAGRVLNNDVLSNLLQAPLKTMLGPPKAPDDEHKTPVASEVNPPLPLNGKSKGKSRREKAKAKRLAAEAAATSSAADSESSLVGSDEHDTFTSRSAASTPALRVGTSGFVIVDDRLSDEEEEEVIPKPTIPVKESAPPPPKQSTSKKEKKKKEKEKEKEAKDTKAKVEVKVEQVTAAPTIVKYHQKGYIPQNTDEGPAVDVKVMQSVLVNAVKNEGKQFPLLDRNDWVRELLQLIHTRKDFVDTIYNDYKAQISKS